MDDYSYDEFDKMEAAAFIKDGGYRPSIKRKYNAKDFLLNLLNDRTYTLNEIEVIAREADLTFGAIIMRGTDIEDYEVEKELGNLIMNGTIEMRYDGKGRVLYGLTEKSRKR
jgi:hypothetical protein